MDISKNKTFPKTGTAKRTALGSFWNFFSIFIRALEQIIFVPLFLWAWGKALYGEWMTLFSMMGYLSISNLGMGEYILNKMTQTYSKGNYKDYAKIFKSAFGIYLLISIILIILLAFFSFFTPFLDWFNIDSANAFSARLSLLILGSYIILGTISGLINGLYVTVGKFVKSKILNNLRDFLLIVFVAIVVFSGGKFISVSLVYLLLLLIFTLFIYFDNVKNHSEIDLKNTKIDWKLGKSFILPGLIFMLIPLSNMIYLQGSVLVISSILGSVAVAIFTVHRTLANLIQRFTNVIDPAIKPELTAGEVRGDYPKIQLIHKFFNKLILFISISLSSILLFVGKDLMNLWTNGEIAFDKNLWIVFIVLVPVLAFWSFNSSFQEATNKYGKLAIARISTTILGLILAILLGNQFGLIGILIGFLISELLIDFWYIPYNTLEIIKSSKKKFVITMFGVIPMIALQILSGWAVAIFIENIWLKIILEGIIVIGIGILYVYYIWFDKEEKNITNDFIKRIKNKFIKYEK